MNVNTTRSYQERHSLLQGVDAHIVREDLKKWECARGLEIRKQIVIHATIEEQRYY